MMKARTGGGTKCPKCGDRLTREKMVCECGFLNLTKYRDRKDPGPLKAERTGAK
jgi:hypothetical protein